MGENWQELGKRQKSSVMGQREENGPRGRSGVGAGEGVIKTICDR